MNFILLTDQYHVLVDCAGQGPDMEPGYDSILYVTKINAGRGTCYYIPLDVASNVTQYRRLLIDLALETKPVDETPAEVSIFGTVSYVKVTR